MIAAIAGNTVNYWIGYWIGDEAKNIKWIKQDYMDRTHAFFEKYGGKTIFLARFVPIIRTFAPFVAGVGKMPFDYFSLYNVSGCVAWVALFTFAGYFFGNIRIRARSFLHGRDRHCGGIASSGSMGSVEGTAGRRTR